MNCRTIGKGKFKDEHYQVVTNLILETCKGFWLRPKSLIKELEGQDPLLEVKRRLFGCFLTYTMFCNQPHYSGADARLRVNINIDPGEIDHYLDFSKDVDKLESAKEIKFILLFLRLENAYSYCLTSTEVGFV
jgi:hypothetical protein